MVTGQQCIALIILSLFIGILAGVAIWYWCGHPKCEHNWEKIIDERIEDKCEHGKPYILHTVVHMCTKCGKRQVTKI